MSILLLEASTQTLAQVQAGDVVLISYVALALIAMIFAVIRGSIVGPARLASDESVQPLLVLTLLALSLWLLIPGIYGSVVAGPEATTQPEARLSPRQTVTLGIVDATVVSAFLLFGNARWRQDGLKRLGLFLQFLPRGLAIGFLAALVVVPLTLAVAVASEQFWQWRRYEHPPAHEMLEILGQAQEPAMRALVIFSALVAAPVFEELLFRGHLQTLFVGLFSSLRLRSRSAVRWLAVIMTSVMFALVHGELWMMPPIFFLSMGLGYVYERSGNLWTAIIVHMLFNAVNVTLYLQIQSR